MKDKAALDVIAKKARAQKKVEWFKKIRNDPKALKALVGNYNSAVAESQRSGAKRAVWNLATYFEEWKATAETGYVGRVKLMWEDQAVEFWQSTAGGSMSKGEAEARWRHEAMNRDELGIAWDKKGPAKSPLRLAVPFEDVIDDVMRVGTAKRLGLFSLMQLCISKGAVGLSRRTMVHKIGVHLGPWAKAQKNTKKCSVVGSMLGSCEAFAGPCSGHLWRVEHVRIESQM